MRRRKQGGMTLLEVLVAASLVGLSFAALFSVFSVSLRSVERIQTHAHVVAFAEAQMNELLLADLQPGHEYRGEEANGMRWEARTELFDRIRPTDEATRAPSVVRVRLTVFWKGRKNEQTYTLETLTLTMPPKEAQP